MAQADTPGAGASPRGALIPIATMGFDAPLRWLRKGWLDLRATGYRGLLYGLVFALMGIALTVLHATHWQLTMALTAGFFLLGPFVCAGVYELSRQRERGEPIDLMRSLTCWRRNLGALAFFAALLMLLLIFWARISIVIFALFSNSADMPSLQGMFAQSLDPKNFEFIAAWVGVGFLFASLAFAISVVSVPMMLDRGSDAMTAIAASVRALYRNTGPIYLWAALIVLIIGASLLLWFVPLVVTAPLVAHATWHSYRELVGQGEAS